MNLSTILIIEGSGQCPPAVSKVFETKGAKVLTASKVDVAMRIMSDNRPGLILADCAVKDPLFWLKEADRLGLETQVAAICDQPDFDQAMEWVSAGVLTVLPRPLDAARLEKLAAAARDNSDTFQQLKRRLGDDQSASMADFYRGLCGRLECGDLRKYIIESCKKITGARRVELCLSDLFSNYCLNLDTNEPIHIASEGCGEAGPSDSELIESAAARQYNISYVLKANGMTLGDLRLHFEDESQIKLTRQQDLVEMVMAISNALGAAATHSKAVKLAAHDALTGLFNRRIFMEVLKREFAKAQRHNYSLSLLVLDLDHFKKVNDTYGHQAGDEVLKAVANTISQVVRNTDLAARIGGEEFAVLLPHSTQDQAMGTAQRLKKKLAEVSFEISGNIFNQTISQGVADLEHFMVKSPEDMIYWADQSLYLAKNEGRDTIRRASDLPMTPISKDGAYAFQ